MEDSRPVEVDIREMGSGSTSYNCIKAKGTALQTLKLEVPGWCDGTQLPGSPDAAWKMSCERKTG